MPGDVNRMNSIPFEQDPLYHQAMDSFQHGNWSEGLSDLNKLIESYPLEPELRSLNQEMELRAKVDNNEIEDEASKKHKRMIKLGLGAATAILVIIFLVWGFQTYSSWIQNQLQTAQSNMTKQAQDFELRVKFNNARSLLAANRIQEAESLVGQIAEINQEFPELEGLQRQINDLKLIDQKYSDAVSLMDAGSAGKALVTFHEIQLANPGYKDVPQLIDALERNSLLDDLYNQANTAYQNQEWAYAIDTYESVRSLDSSYRSHDVEEKLFQSYLNAGEDLLNIPGEGMTNYDQASTYFRMALALRPQDTDALAKQAEAQKSFADLQISEYINQAATLMNDKGDSLDALQSAEELFNEALRLRPNDEDIVNQVDIGRKYLQAIQEFEKGNWNFVIGNLESVYTDDPEYADGTARQALYEAYMGRGEAFLVSGDFYSALTDFQRAAVIALQSPDSLLRLLQAQMRVAEVKGLLGEYEEAVRVFETAADQVQMRSLAQEQDVKLERQILSAQKLADLGDYRSSYQQYREIMRNLYTLFSLSEYMVQEGDYLPSIARRFNTTIEAMASANKLDNVRELQPGQRLVIPSLNQQGMQTGHVNTPQP
jgi:tetratricopeptide (TPR) repeat protein